MNRHAAVLAADSASTVTRWVNGQKETRYFKGSNKIFQLSNQCPVGMMVFASGEVMRVPWEIVAKQFRRHLGVNSFDTIREYAQALFSFMEADHHLFPDEVRGDIFVAAAETAAIRVLIDVVRPSGASDADYKALLDQAVSATVAATTAAVPGAGLPADAAAQIEAKWGATLLQEITDWVAAAAMPVPDDLSGLATAAIKLVLSEPQDYLDSTGIVVAGYGEHDVFPSLVEYRCFGLIDGAQVVREISSSAVTHRLPATISAFAQTDMADTFQFGFGQDTYSSVLGHITTALNDFAANVVADSGGDFAAIPDLASRIAEARAAVSDAWLAQAQTDHIFPLRRVLDSLPIDQMADLAETLINLQSLKERVTKASETVGGAVDVAVITKSEGLVWIKRKHFFDQQLNPRFMQRQAAQH